jgi:hypothetical protein
MVLGAQLPRATDSTTDSPAMKDKAANRQRTEPKPNLATMDTAAQAQEASLTSAVRGVTWEKQRGVWHTQVRVHGKNIHFRCRPDDKSSSAIEKARLQAEQKQRVFKEKRNKAEIAQVNPQSLSRVTGVSWERKKWQARINGVNVDRWLVPDVKTSHAIYRARLLVERKRSELEEERDQSLRQG